MRTEHGIDRSAVMRLGPRVAAGVFLLAAVPLGRAGELQLGILEQLASRDLRYFEGRHAAAAELARGGLDTEALRQLLASEDENTRRVACEVIARAKPPGGAALLLERLTQEPSPSLQRRMAVVLARAPACSDSATRARLLGTPLAADKGPGGPHSPARHGGGRQLAILYGDYVLERTRQAVETLLHDGTVPGFYDGQFDGLYAIDPDMFDWLARIAVDPDFNFVFRVMAIMALHQARDEREMVILKPLLVAPSEEIRFETSLNMRHTEDELAQRQQVSLSRYCRFSLAKAGFPEEIEKKILYLLAELGKYEGLLERLKGRLKGELPLEVELGVELMFEIGYNHQQLDRYPHSIFWYSKVIREWPTAQSAVNAHYNLACIYALLNQKKLALDHLELAVAKGFTDFRWIIEDEDLRSLRQEARFLDIVGLVKEREQEKRTERPAGADARANG
ncbi:MAG: HEAT repeat domain-containing protein [Planctomycetota bacterium]